MLFYALEGLPPFLGLIISSFCFFILGKWLVSIELTVDYMVFQQRELHLESPRTGCATSSRAFPPSLPSRIVPQPTTDIWFPLPWNHFLHYKNQLKFHSPGIPLATSQHKTFPLSMPLCICFLPQHPACDDFRLAADFYYKQSLKSPWGWSPFYRYGNWGTGKLCD